MNSITLLKELKTFLDKIKDTDIAVPIMLIGVYGLRRNEALGVKWDRINFEDNQLTIAHTVVQIRTFIRTLKNGGKKNTKAIF